jgi:hypothetical protein
VASLFVERDVDRHYVGLLEERLDIYELGVELAP